MYIMMEYINLHITIIYLKNEVLINVGNYNHEFISETWEKIIMGGCMKK